VLHHDPHLGFTLTHAGIYPSWDLAKAQALAQELEQALQDTHFALFLQNMYGNQPRIWDEQLTGWERLRFITNAFTRMRFIAADGGLDLKAKGHPQQYPENTPWFAVPQRAMAKEKLIFGHWAALGAESTWHNIYPLDSGCVWGQCLTALCLETQQRFTVDCKAYAKSPFLT